MVGSVLYQEMLLGSRHGRWHWLRWLYAGWLLAILVVNAYAAQLASLRGSATLSALSLMATYYLPFFSVQHFVILTLATPTLAAGAITDEKTRGTLQYLLTADLLSWELIVGKLLGRIYQVFLLVSLSLPLLCFFGVFAGLGAVKVLGFLACTVLLVFALGAASMLASVWCRHTRDAVLGLYAVGLLVAAAATLASYVLGGAAAEWLDGALELYSPFLPLGPRWPIMDDAEYLGRLGAFALGWSGLGLVCLAVAVLRLRRAYVRQLEGAGRTKRPRWWRSNRPPVRGSPLTWKERHVEGIAPLAVLRHVPTWLGVLLVFLLSTALYGSLLLANLPAGTTAADVVNMVLEGRWEALLNTIYDIHISHEVFWYRGLAVVLVAALVVGVRCSGAVTREREKQTWEALLMTPLSARQLIRGKLWGIAGACVPYLIAYAIPAVLLSVIAGPGPFLWTLLWLGVLALAIWYAGAAGLWCSVGAKSSWRSLLNTLGFLYGFGAVLAFLILVTAALLTAVLGILLFILQMIVAGTLAINPWFTVPSLYMVGVSVAMAAGFFLLAWRLLVSAEFRVSVTERTRHWKGEPKRPIRSSAPRPVALPQQDAWDQAR